MSIRDPIEDLFAIKNGAPLILAPMAGVTDRPFRLLARRFGADLAVSEMIASQAMIRQAKRSMKMSEGLAEEQPLAVQIAGADPAVMADAARMNVDRGAGLIDINMGCPVKKIVKSGGGAALLRDEALMGRIIEAVAAAVDPIPVTVKMRLGWDHESRNGVQLARTVERSGARALAVHGRTRSQMYRGAADWEAIAEIKRSLTIPVIGNGDIDAPELAVRRWRESGVDGLMIGRGALGRPWIFAQIRRLLEGGPPLPDPEIEARHRLASEHFEALLDFYGTRTGIQLAKKHLGWHSRGLHGGSGFRRAVNTASDPETIRESIARLFTSSQAREQA